MVLKNTETLGLVKDSPLLDVAGLDAVCVLKYAIGLMLASPVYSALGGVRDPVHISEHQVADGLNTPQNVLEILNCKRTLMVNV